MKTGEDRVKGRAQRVSTLRSRCSVEEDGLRLELKELVVPHGAGRELADKIGVSQQYLSDVVRGRRRVSDAVVAKLMEL